jgi:hypothetical protein
MPVQLSKSFKISNAEISPWRLKTCTYGAFNLSARWEKLPGDAERESRVSAVVFQIRCRSKHPHAVWLTLRKMMRAEEQSTGT